jgi:flagellar export protein FliJ
MPAAKFKFALEPLLRARIVEEQARQRAVADIERERLYLEETLRSHQAHIAEGKDSLRENLVGRIDPAMLRLHASASLSVMRAAQRIVLELAGVHNRLNAARSELIESARRRRAIELLRERRLEQWKQQVNKTEDDALDELTVIAAARSHSAHDSLREQQQDQAA